MLRRETHNYLGMDLDYSNPGKAKISMIKYLQKVFDNFLEEIKSTQDLPGAEYLLNRNTARGAPAPMP